MHPGNHGSSSNSKLRGDIEIGMVAAPTLVMAMSMTAPTLAMVEQVMMPAGE